MPDQKQDVKIAALDVKIAAVDVKVGSLDTKVALVDNRLEGIREQQKAHAENSTKQFDRIFDYLRPMSEWVSSNKDLPSQVNTLWDFHQQNKGFLSATRLLTASIGGAVVAMVDFLFRLHQ